MTKKFEKITINNDDLIQFKLTTLLIAESSKNLQDSVENASTNFLIKYDKSIDVQKVLYDYSKLSVEYMYMKSYVVAIYNMFEQYIKILFDIDNIKNFYDEKQYYCWKDNSYYEIVNQCRLLNNSIKHGTIPKALEQKYINHLSLIKNNTILDNSLKIEVDYIDEFCVGIIRFVDELIDYYRAIGMYEEII